MGRKAINITGQRFGRAVAIKRAGLVSGAVTWACKCDCGKSFIAFGGNLRKGDTSSCGCVRTEVTRQRSFKHGHTAGARRRTKTYRCWSNMLSRCYNPKVKAWANYGGRGITVCQRWWTFTNFLADMGEAPELLTLDRKNNSKGYSKSNCRWATVSQQNRNRRPFKRRTND